MGFVALAVSSAQPVISICLMAGTGALLALKGVLSKEGQQKLAVLVFIVFMPALAFTKLLLVVNPSTVAKWWPLWLGMGWNLFFGATLGALLSRLLRVPRSTSIILIVACGFGNVGNMMLVSVSTVCAETELHLTPEGVSVQECIAEGVGYVMFSIAVSVLLTFGLVPNILRRGKMYGELEEQELLAETPATELVLVDDAPPTHTHTHTYDPTHEHTPFKTRVMPTHPHHPHPPPSPPPPAAHDSTPHVRLHSHVLPVTRGSVQGGCGVWGVLRSVVGVVQGLPWKDLLPPSSVAAILATIVGCIPLLKDVLVSDTAPLGVVYQSADMMAGSTIPCMMLGLGATLITTRGGKALPLRVIGGVFTVRLILLPLLGIFMMWMLEQTGMLVEEPLFRLTLLLQQTVPTGITVQMIATMLDFGAAELGTLLFWQYVAAIAVTPCWTMLYFRMLGLQT